MSKEVVQGFNFLVRKSALDCSRFLEDVEVKHTFKRAAVAVCGDNDKAIS